MQDDNRRTISFRDLSWDNVDEYIKKTTFKDRSPFVEYCVSKEIHKRRFGDVKLVEILMLLLLSMISLGILLLWMVK